MKILYFILLLLLLAVPYIANCNPLILAVAEEPDPHDSKGPAIIRILFQKQGDAWIALNNEAIQDKLNIKIVDWTIAFDGKNLGSITSVDDFNIKYPDCERCFPRDKIFRVQNPDSFPNLGNKEERFDNWDYLPKNRPVVLVSSPNYKDPENWKRFDPPKEFIDKVFPKLKEIIT